MSPKWSSFDGKMPWDEYMALFETASMVHQWSYATKAAMLSLPLQGDVLAILKTIPLQDRHNYEELVKQLETWFGHRNMDQVSRPTGHSWKACFRNRTRTYRSLKQIYLAWWRLYTYPTKSEDVCESLMAIDKSLDSLRKLETQKAVKLACPKTFKSIALSKSLSLRLSDSMRIGPSACYYGRANRE